MPTAVNARRMSGGRGRDGGVLAHHHSARARHAAAERHSRLGVGADRAGRVHPARQWHGVPSRRTMIRTRNRCRCRIGMVRGARTRPELAGQARSGTWPTRTACPRWSCPSAGAPTGHSSSDSRGVITVSGPSRLWRNLRWPEFLISTVPAPVGESSVPRANTMAVRSITNCSAVTAGHGWPSSRNRSSVTARTHARWSCASVRATLPTRRRRPPR